MCVCVCVSVSVSVSVSVCVRACIIIRDLRGGVCSVAHSVLGVVSTLNLASVCTHFPCGDCVCMHYLLCPFCAYVCRSPMKL